MTTQSSSLKERSWFSRNLGEILVQIFLISVGIIIAMPILIALFTSFKEPSQVITYPPKFFPETWTIRNYEVAWTSTPFARFWFNSLVQTILIVIGQVLFCVMAAYAFSFFEFPGKNGLFLLILGSLMIPFELVFIPNFQLVSSWGWGNTFQGLTVPFLASAFGVFMLRQFFLTVPKELHDAALIDGASNWRFLWQILVPLSKGSIGAFAIFAFLSAWNQYLWPLVITDEEKWRTIQIGIRFFMQNVDRGSDWGAVMAGSILALFWPLVAFLVAQKQLVKGIAMTGLKG